MIKLLPYKIAISIPHYPSQDGYLPFTLIGPYSFPALSIDFPFVFYPPKGEFMVLSTLPFRTTIPVIPAMLSFVSFPAFRSSFALPRILDTLGPPRLP